MPEVRAALTAVTMCLVATAASCSSDGASSTGGTSAPDGTSTTTTTAEVSTVDGSSAGLAAVPGLVRRIEPSIVAIFVTRGATAGSEGSGVIVRSRGVIVTNLHVVAGAAEVSVALADGTPLPAVVEAADPLSDLAILRVDRDDLPAAELSDSYPEIGELAVAVGNPLGFQNTVTAGIVSGVGRSIPAAAAPGGQSLVDLIQTDAAISPGNSGGALVGGDGRIIGINVAYLPPMTGAVSLGFAIPAPTVHDVVEELLEDGTADHAYMGIRLATVSPQIADDLDLAIDGGAAIIAVERDGPAHRAGLRPGDVVTAIDRQRIRDVAGILTQLRRYDPGDTATLDVARADGAETIDVTFSARPTS